MTEGKAVSAVVEGRLDERLVERALEAAAFAPEGGRIRDAVETVIDVSGFVVAPGFVDLHCHLREPGFEDAETIATGSRAAAAGGFTTLCALADTQPSTDTGSDVESVSG